MIKTKSAISNISNQSKIITLNHKYPVATIKQPLDQYQVLQIRKTPNRELKLKY